MQETTAIGLNFIGGEWKASSGGKIYEVRNPADQRSVVGIYQSSDELDTMAAIEAAKKAFKMWASTPAPKRAEIVFEAWSILKKRAEEFSLAITTEEGKPLPDARGEVKRSLNVLEFIAGEGRRLGGDVIPSELPKTLIYTYKRPLGVVAVITPWNFPLSIPVWKIAPALVSGNTVVFKPASCTPGVAIKICKLFEEAGLPPGVLNMVTGPGGSVGRALVESADVKGVSFTGSTETGRWIYENSSKGMKKVQCEMGGKNAVVIADDADLDLAVEGVVQGAFGSSGQRCTATSRVVVDRAVKGEFLERLLDRTEKLKVGPGTEPGVDVGPLSSVNQMEKVLWYISDAISEGAKLLTGGKRVTDKGLEHGLYVEPTVFDEVSPNMRIAREEIFGPVLSVLSGEGIEELIGISNDSDYGLSGSIYTRNIEKAMRYIDQAEAGMLHVNCPTLGGEAQAPFGGIKGSGIGQREQGRKAVEFFTEEVVVYIDYTGSKRDAKFI